MNSSIFLISGMFDTIELKKKRAPRDLLAVSIILECVFKKNDLDLGNTNERMNKQYSVCVKTRGGQQ